MINRNVPVFVPVLWRLLMLGVVGVGAASWTPLAFSAGATMTVTGTVTESSATVTVNGVVATVNGTSFTAQNVPLAFGPNTVTAVATDAVGNSSSQSITVHVGTRITLQGTANEPISAVTVNGVAGTVTGNTFSAVVTLKLGINTLTVNATDLAGNSTTTQCRVYLVRPPVGHP